MLPERAHLWGLQRCEQLVCQRAVFANANLLGAAASGDRIHLVKSVHGELVCDCIEEIAWHAERMHIHHMFGHCFAAELFDTMSHGCFMLPAVFIRSFMLYSGVNWSTLLSSSAARHSLLLMSLSPFPIFLRITTIHVTLACPPGLPAVDRLFECFLFPDLGVVSGKILNQLLPVCADHILMGCSSSFLLLCPGVPCA